MARFYSSRFQSERVTCSDGLKVPILNSDPLDGEDAEMMYIDGQLKYYYNGEWQNVKVKRRDGSTAAAAALNATDLKNTLGASASNGAYWYQYELCSLHINCVFLKPDVLIKFQTLHFG